MRELALYRITHNIQPVKDKSIVKFLEQNNFLYIFVVISTLIIATKIITDEYKSNSIKLLLTSSNKRSRILFSKYFVVAITPFITMLFVTISSIIIAGFLLGFGNLNSIYLEYSNGQIKDYNYLLYILKDWLFESFSLFCLSSMSVLLGLIFKNPIISILSSVLSYILGTYFTIRFVNYSWFKYTLFAHVNSQIYENENIVLTDITDNFTLSVLAIYTLIFVIFSFVLFQLQDN